MRVAIVALGILLAIAAQSPDPKTGATELNLGAYYWTGADWKTLQQTTMTGAGGKKMAKLLVPGLTPQIVYTFREARAPLQISEARPLFCYRMMAASSPYMPNGRSIVIARFDEKKDHRELQTTSGGNAITFKSGLSKERAPELVVTELKPGTYLISPKDNLSAGEYLLTALSTGSSGFDFGLHPPKKP